MEKGEETTYLWHIYPKKWNVRNWKFTCMLGNIEIHDENVFSSTLEVMASQIQGKSCLGTST